MPRLTTFLALLLALAGPLAAASENPAPGTISLRVEGRVVTFQVTSAHIFLTDTTSALPVETFQIRGPGLVLTGVLPSDAHVGTEANWKALAGRWIRIRPWGGDPAENARARLNLPDSSLGEQGNAARPVVNGYMTVEKVVTKGGLDAPAALTGYLFVEVQYPEGTRTYHGRYNIDFQGRADY
jgi:hypothetical protein